MDQHYTWRMSVGAMKWKAGHDVEHPRKLTTAELRTALRYIDSHKWHNPFAEELCRRAGLPMAVKYAMAKQEKDKRRAVKRAIRKLAIIENIEK